MKEKIKAIIFMVLTYSMFFFGTVGAMKLLGCELTDEPTDYLVPVIVASFFAPIIQRMYEKERK